MWCAFGYVTCSGYRTMVLKSLSNGEKTPYMIAEDCGLLPSDICKTLRQLRDYGLISCRNPNKLKRVDCID